MTQSHRITIFISRRFLSQPPAGWANESSHRWCFKKNEKY